MADINDPGVIKIIYAGAASVISAALASLGTHLYWKGQYESSVKGMQRDISNNTAKISILEQGTVPLSRCDERQKACQLYQLSEFGHGEKKMDIFDKALKDLTGVISRHIDASNDQHTAVIKSIKDGFDKIKTG